MANNIEQSHELYQRLAILQGYIYYFIFPVSKLKKNQTCAWAADNTAPVNMPFLSTVV